MAIYWSTPLVISIRYNIGDFDFMGKSQNSLLLLRKLHPSTQAIANDVEAQEVEFDYS